MTEDTPQRPTAPAEDEITRRQGPLLPKQPEAKPETAPEAKPEHKPTEPRQTEPKQNVRIPKVWPLWLAILLILLLLAGGVSWTWSYLQTWQSRLDQAISQTEASSTLLNQSGQRYENRMSQIDDEIQNNRSEVNEVRELVNQTARRILATGQTGRTDWLLAEAEYLIRLANQRLLMEKDYEGSLAILQTADEVLAETKEVATFPIRKALAEEIVSLQSVASIDTQGIFLRLEAMTGQLAKLDDSLFFEDAPLLNDPPVAGEDPPEPQWYDKALSTLQQHLVIRRLDHQVKPLPAPDQIYYLKQNLRLMLEQAGLALLERDQQIYVQSLSKAEQWIQDYFLSKEPATQAMLKNLDELKAIQIDPELPDISESLRLLRNLLETIYKQGPPNEGQSMLTPATGESALS